MSQKATPSRPVLPMPYIRAEMIVQIGTAILLILAWYMARKYYLQLPETIAIHFDFAGNPDGYGSSKTIFLVPAITTIISVAIAFLARIPEKFNYLTTITEANAQREYRKARMLLFAICFFTAVVALVAVWKIGAR